MAQNYKTGLIITGDASGGIRAIKATDDELGKLNQGFERGSRKSKQFNQDVNATSQGLAVLRRAAAPIAGVIAGMFAANTLQGQINWADQLQKTNLRIGASTEALSQYNYVASLSGVEFNQLTTAWQRQTRRIAEAAAGTGVAVAALDKLNLSAKELNQLAPEEQFERIAAAMQGVENSSERVRLAQQLWDSEGVKLVQIVNSGTDAIAAMRAEADALGLTISQDTANGMATYNDEVARLQFAAQGLSQTLLSELVPSLTESLQTANSWVKELGGAEVIVGNLTDAAAVLAALMAGRYAGAFAAATAAKIAATSQSILYQAALARMAGVSGVAAASQTALAIATRGASSAMLLVGGPVGAAVLATGALGVLANRLDNTAERAANMEFRANELAESLQHMGETSIRTQLAAVTLEMAKLEGAQEALEVQSRRSSRTNSVLAADFRNLQETIEVTAAAQSNTSEESDKLKTQQMALEKALELVTGGARGAANEVNEFGGVTSTAAAAAREAAKETTTLANSYEDLLDRIQPNRRAARQYAKDVGVLNLALATGRMTTVQYMQAMGMLQVSFQAAQRETDNTAKASEDASQRIANSFISWETVADNTLRRVDDSGQSLWLGLIDGSESALDIVKRGFQQTLAEIIHMLTTQKLTFSVAGMMGLDTTGMPDAGDSQSFGTMPSLSGMMDGSGAIANAYRAFQGTGSTYAGTFGSELAVQTEGGLRAGFDSFAASGLGNAALGIGGGLAGGYAGTAIGSAVFGKNANSSYGAMGGAALGQALIPIPGLGAAIGGALGGLADSLFGSGKKSFDFDFVQGAQPGVFGDRTSALGDFGIAKFSDYKLGEQQDALQALMDQIANFDNTLANAAIDTRVDAMRASIEGFTHSGPEDLFDTRLRALIDGSGALVESAIAQIVDPQQMADAFLSVLNIERVMQSLNSQVQSDVAAHLEANTTNIQGTADSLTQAINSTVLLGNSAERLNWQFDDAAGGAIHYAWSLQEAVGGLDALSGMGASYYQNYFTQAEREAELREQISETMRELGLEMPKTRDGFRALVEAQSLNTDAGTANVAALLQLESAFAQLTPAIEGTGDAASSTGEALRTQEQLSRQLLQAQGNTDALRQIEIDRLSELENAEIDNLTMMQKRLWAIEDEKVAQQEAERAQQARTREIEQEAQAWSRAREQLASFGVGIDNWIDGLQSTDKGLGSPGDKLAAASAAFDEQYAKAASGDRAAMSSITQYADRFIEAQKGWSASGAQTVGTIDRVTGMLAKLPDQLTPEQFIVDGIRDVVTNELADEIERAIMDSKYTISTLIDFATNTDQLPTDLRTILGEQSHRLDSTLSYLVGENQLTSELERLAIGSTNTLVATVKYITFSELADDNKRLALSSSNTMTAVVDYAVRSDLDNASRRLALESSNVYSAMIEYAIERDISAEDRHLALDSINRYTAVVEYVARSELTAGNRQLALGSLNEYDAIIDYATRNDIAGADRTLAVEHGNRYLANVDYIVGRKLTPNNRRLALQSNHNYVSVIDQVVGMALKGSDRRLALESTNRYQTIVDAVLADGISPDVRKFALSKSNSLLATVDGILESGLSHDVRTLALEDSNHFVTTLEAALADGRLSHDERTLLDAQSDTIIKRLETSGLQLTPDEWAVINAASGTRRLDLLADVAFKASDLEELGAIRRGAEGTKANTDAAKDAAKGMRVTFADHQSPTALKGIGHWLTFKHKEAAGGIGHKYAEQFHKWAERIGRKYVDAGVGGVNGSHASGAWNIGFDGYLAELHKGEMVVPAGPANALRELATSGASVPKLSMSSPRDMPMPSVPLPQFPTLGNSDVLQVLQDVKRELIDTRKQNKTLHAENARLLAAANAQRGSGFLREIDAIKEGNKMLKRMQDDMALEGVRR
ncbi:hypothetical protein [Vreelandella venusta]|uniref:hypothetical protein n=1 Tax=Vreelandella venusta TaxID=44935 RepID=UPI001F11BF43|nr:hypothetical protein [Halomonas venusta]